PRLPGRPPGADQPVRMRGILGSRLDRGRQFPEANGLVMTALPGEPETDAGTAGVSEAASAQADQVLRLLAAAEGAGLPLWLSGGWAIDARLNRVTREHGDIDVAFPRERESGLVSLLQSMGPFSLERTDYGFLARSGTLLVD